jgi:hypothetical protein
MTLTDKINLFVDKLYEDLKSVGTTNIDIACLTKPSGSIEVFYTINGNSKRKYIINQRTEAIYPVSPNNVVGTRICTLDKFMEWFWGGDKPVKNPNYRKQIDSTINKEKIDKEIDNELSDLWNRREYKI